MANVKFSIHLSEMYFLMTYLMEKNEYDNNEENYE